ncbi:hypothetical protein WJX74_007490 [Apatococcus lobatus]|uniref:F-box domain-containing protein n=1 Tax=Apatococcus lobatus TaxID=904363 RepID=A0AAW1RC63_9CHLO
MQAARPLKALARDLWQLVFNHLSSRERLQIRTVCKLFSNLEGHADIEIKTDLPSKTATDSLLLFLGRRSNFSSPGIKLKLAGTWILGTCCCNPWRLQ